MTSLLDWRLLPGRDPVEPRLRAIRAHDRPTPLPDHVGAWLDRYLWEGTLPGPPNPEDKADDAAAGKDKPGRMALLETAIEALKPTVHGAEAWKFGYKRWKNHFCPTTSELGIRRLDFIVEATSRILLHVSSGASVTDGSILLHHTWGVPYLPGSALKGVVRSALTKGSLRQRFAPDDAVIADLLGQGPSKDGDDEPPQRAAFIDFLDAPWVPSQPTSPLLLDVVTPHHSRYYTLAGDERPYPTDFDEPVPTHRLSIAPKTQFHVVLEADSDMDERWLEGLKHVLVTALESDGIGAWTTSGYGRLKGVTTVTTLSSTS